MSLSIYFLLVTSRIYFHIFRLKYEKTGAGCSTANIFGAGLMGNDLTAADYKYKGIIWTTFRGVQHSMARLQLKIRPIKFEPTGEETMRNVGLQDS